MASATIFALMILQTTYVEQLLLAPPRSVASKNSVLKLVVGIRAAA